MGHTGLACGIEYYKDNNIHKQESDLPAQTGESVGELILSEQVDVFTNNMNPDNCFSQDKNITHITL